MDRKTAQMLATMALIVMVINFVLIVLQYVTLGIYYFVMGLFSPVTSGSSDVLFPVLIIILVIVILIGSVLPIINLIFGYFKVYKPLKENNYSDNVKFWVLVTTVLAFIGGGGVIPAVMYLIIFATWNQLAYPSHQYPYPPPGYYPPPPRKKRKHR
jgi:hypothetical protein